MVKLGNLKRMLTAVLIGCFCRFLYEQLYTSIAIIWNTPKENCVCNSNNFCIPCKPTKVFITNKKPFEKFKPRGMYEVTRWQLFDEDYIFDIINQEPKIKLQGPLKEYIKEMVKLGVDYINLNAMMGKQWSLHHLKNGYIYFDSIYGTDIILDLLVKPVSSTDNHFIVNEQLFRVVMKHSFNEVMNLKLQKNEKKRKSKLKILVPISLSSVHLHAVVERFEFIHDQNVEFILILFHENFGTASNLTNAIKQKVARSSKHIKVIQREEPYSYLEGLLSGFSQTDSEDLVMVLEDDVTMTDGLLHHCRSICIEKTRVLFAVPFAQFNPKVIEEGMPPGKLKDLNKNDHDKFTGQWAFRSHKNFCAYYTDVSNMLYAAGKTKLEVNGRWVYNDYLNQEYEVVMAVEPNLYKLNHNEKCFLTKQVPEEYSQCMKHKVLHLGSKPALGVLYIKEILKKN